MSHYSTLGLPEHASPADIRRAYRQLVLLTHPDRTPDPAAHARYLAINAAYETLSDPARRQAYDQGLNRPVPAPEPVASPGRSRDRRRHAARKPNFRRTAPPNDVAAEPTRFLHLVRPVLIGALVLCATLVIDLFWRGSALKRWFPPRLLRISTLSIALPGAALRWKRSCP